MITHSLVRRLARPFYVYQGHLKLSGIREVVRLGAALLIHSIGSIYSRTGSVSRFCPCCEWKGKNFLPYIAGGYVTFQAACPDCRWHGRHRGHRLFYDRIFKLMERKGRLLYFAPEDSVLDYVKANDRLEVKTTNFQDNSTDYDIDVMDIPFEDNSWDFIICHRVIEHIPDDRRGMKELFRVLKPTGLLLLSVPIYREKTIDYGKPNPLEDYHYYSYGLDFESRIPEAFQITRYKFSELFSSDEFESLALMEDYIFVCQKPAA